jgi:hypothetical protein
MTDVLKIPAHCQIYLIAVRDETQDKFDVVEFVYEEPDSNVSTSASPSASASAS